MKKQMNKTLIIPCPQCKKMVAWLPKNVYRPFCSKSCQLLDFGLWSSDSYVINDDNLEDLANSSSDEVNE